MIKIDGYAIDIAKSEHYSFESEVTSFPVEQGSDISDHVRVGPLHIEIECVVSNSPIGRVASDPSRIPVDAADTKSSDDAFQRLLKIRDARQPVSYEGRRGRFENMVLSFDVPDDVETNDGLIFTATLKQVQIVENRRVTIKTVSAVPRGKPKIDRGALSANERKEVDDVQGPRWLVTTIRPGQTTNDRIRPMTEGDLLRQGSRLMLISNAGRHYRVDDAPGVRVTDGVTASGPLSLADGWVVATKGSGKGKRYEPFKEDPRAAWSTNRSPGEASYREYKADPKNYWRKVWDNAGVPSDDGGLPESDQTTTSFPTPR